jgi:hypothetical protein
MSKYTGYDFGGAECIAHPSMAVVDEQPWVPVSEESHAEDYYHDLTNSGIDPKAPYAHPQELWFQRDLTKAGWSEGLQPTLYGHASDALIYFDQTVFANEVSNVILPGGTLFMKDEDAVIYAVRDILLARRDWLVTYEKFDEPQADDYRRSNDGQYNMISKGEPGYEDALPIRNGVLIMMRHNWWTSIFTS